MRMKRTLTRLAIACLIALSACGTSGDLDDGGGTSVSNPPTVSTVTLVPDFDTRISEAALTSEASASESAELFLTAGGDGAYLDGPAAYWSEVVLNGSVNQARRLRRLLETIMESVEERIEADDDFELSETSASYTVGGGNLFGFSRDWRVLVGLRSDDFVKVAIMDAETGFIWAYYAFERDADGDPERGVFAFVNPSALSRTREYSLRFFGASYDFSDTSSNRLSLTAEIFASDDDRFIVHHHAYECDVASKDCVAEFVRVDSEPPLRRFSSARSVRLSWNDDTKLICLALVSYDGDTVTLGTTQEFTGPEAPEEASEGTCTVADPFWGSRVLSAEDLPSRFEDDEESGGFAARLYGDGASESPWESALTADTTDAWLLGMFE